MFDTSQQKKKKCVCVVFFPCIMDVLNKPGVTIKFIFICARTLLHDGGQQAYEWMSAHGVGVGGGGGGVSKALK